MKHIVTINRDTLKKSAATGWLRRVPGFLPVRVQDFLHGGQSEVRE